MHLKSFRKFNITDNYICTLSYFWMRIIRYNLYAFNDIYNFQYINLKRRSLFNRRTLLILELIILKKYSIHCIIDLMIKKEKDKNCKAISTGILYLMIALMDNLGKIFEPYI